MAGYVEVGLDGKPTCWVGKEGVSVFRLRTLLMGLKLELKGMRLSRGRSCYAMIKKEFNLRGSKAKVLEQFLPLVQEAERQVLVVGKSTETPPAGPLA